MDRLVVSKSMAKASHCETHFAAHYLDLSPAIRRAVHPLAETGSAFHNYRAIYIAHLVENEVESDQRWAVRWLNSQSVSQDARGIILKDIDRFGIDPQIVMGIELGLSIDADGNPLERQDRCTGPFVATHPEATDSGTLDLLLVEGASARVCDYKSGWSTSGVSDDEPPRYAALVFAHFPRVQVVEFVWEFNRSRAARKVRYERRDLPEIMESLAMMHRKIEDIARRHSAGEKLTVNSNAGLCPFCTLDCPLKSGLEKIDIVPIQTLTDAKKVATLVYIARILASRGGAALKAWIDVNGPVDLGNDWEATIAVTESMELGLVESLRVLGLEVAPLGTMEQFGVQPTLLTPRYPLPIDKLKMRGSQLKSYGKAAKRAGMLDDLRSVAVMKPTSKLAIGRTGEENPMEED